MDHQGINFKAVDKKAVTSKSLIAEVETLYREQHDRPDPNTPRFQLEYTFPNKRVLGDIKNLVEGYLDKMSGLSKVNQDRIVKMMDQLIDTFVSPNDVTDTSVSPTSDAMKVDEATPAEKPKRKFFCSNVYYLFFRLLQLAYSRLSQMREAADNISDIPVGYNRVRNQKSSVAYNLDLIRRDNSTMAS